MSPGGSKRKLDVRLFLWGLFLLQISLICLFLLFGSLLVSTAVDDTNGQTVEQPMVENDGHGQRKAGHPLSDWSPFGVRFIPNRTSTAALVSSENKGAESAAAEQSNSIHLHERQPWVSQGDVQDDSQLLKRKQLHPRHPKYRPWIQRVISRPERMEKYFRTISFVDWHGIRKRRLCFIEGTSGSAQVTSMDQQRSKGSNNETELIDTGKEDVVDNAKELKKGNKKSAAAPDAAVLDTDGSVVTMGEDAISRCRCNSQWHGTDCGQPEVIWRAFITSKIPPRDQMAVPRTVARNVFYIVQSTFISVEVLEIQLMELAEQVSLFVLCDQTRDPTEPPSKDVSIADHLEDTDFLRTLRDRLLIVSDPTCSGRNVFRKLQKYTAKESIRADDIVLLSAADEILNRKAVAYLRWYDNWPQPVRFRLKHNVYGFFWQHASNRTVIGSAAVQVGMLREVYGSDPDRLLAIENPVMLIGDLNHFGGWYCRRCYQPGSIVQYFEHRAGLLSTVPRAEKAIGNKKSEPLLFLPDPKRTKVLNEEYVQQAIASGKDLEDEERALERLSRRTDKYYQPEYVRDNGWKFDNIVLNLFARWDDNLAEDDYFS